MVKKGGRWPNQNVKMASPTKYIDHIGSLTRFPDKLEARMLLQQVAKLVAPIMHENSFKVGTLCEMYPKNGNLLGLNVNRGQKILLRLRYASNLMLFLPLGDILGTMLHELTHNVHGAHDVQFYNFLDKLRARLELLQAQALTSYICEEQKLGTIRGSATATVRSKRLAALKPTFKTERRRLGGSGGNIGNTSGAVDASQLRQLRLQAAERRLQDSKWCGKSTDAEPDISEVEIVDLTNEDEDLTGLETPGNPPKAPSPQFQDDYIVVD